MYTKCIPNQSSGFFFWFFGFILWYILTAIKRSEQHHSACVPWGCGRPGNAGRWTAIIGYIHKCSLSRRVCVHTMFRFCRMSILLLLFWTDRFYHVCLTLLICWDVHPTQQNDNDHPLWNPNFSMHIIVLLSAMSNLRFQPKKRYPPDPFFHSFIFFGLQDARGWVRTPSDHSIPNRNLYSTWFCDFEEVFTAGICGSVLLVSIIISIFPLLKYFEVRVSKCM